MLDRQYGANRETANFRETKHVTVADLYPVHVCADVIYMDVIYVDRERDRWYRQKLYPGALEYEDKQSLRQHRNI